MSARSDVTIVSVFGRGNWLASRLAEQGMKVALVDVSEQMGHWVPEDWEGPFGFFRSELLLQSQLQRLVEDDPEESVDQGFTLWLKNGPMEMKGPLSAFALEKNGVSKDVQKYLLRYASLSEEQRQALLARILSEPFESSWLGHLSHQLSSNIMMPNAQGLESGKPLPLFAPHYLRRVTRTGLERGLEFCRTKGIDVHPRAKIVDIGASRGQVEGVEILSDFSGVLFPKHVVWMLSSEESGSFSRRVSETLYPKGVLESEWYWTRFRVSVPAELPFHALPNKFTMIEDLKLQWSHDNLLCVEKTVKEGDLDVWVRVPTRQRFYRAYLDTTVARVCAVLSDRISLPVTCAQMPQDYIYDQAEVGAPRHPIFSREQLQEFRPGRFLNFFFDGPEFWGGLDWHSQFRAHSVLEKKLLSLNEATSGASRNFVQPENEGVLN